jgi:spore maturation protein CgeB
MSLGAINPLNIVILGLSITSSWGNGHATTYRALVRALAARGHSILFLERNTPWYAAARDLPKPPYCRAVVYKNFAELKKYAGAIRAADLLIVGSYVPNGIAVGDWALKHAGGATAFYDIDTPVTLALLEQQRAPYISAAMIPRYQLYFSFTGGPILERLERRYRAQMARTLYCAVDPDLYQPQPARRPRWHLGDMGTYSAEYPRGVEWPRNVERIEHVRPAAHAAFYGRQRFTLNLTRADMIEAGYSPSVRLFEAAACGCPIISDWWEGLDQFFKVGEEILVADSSEQVTEYLFDLSPDDRRRLGAKARARVLAAHTAAHRAAELESYALKLLGRRPPAQAAARASAAAASFE